MLQLLKNHGGKSGSMIKKIQMRFESKIRKACFLLFLIICTALHASPPKEALLIANGQYSHFAGLTHPVMDSTKLAAALEKLGFRVHVIRNGSREQMLDAISNFERSLRNTGAIAFFHYGGHGVQVDGKNYLLPADADIPDERRVVTRAVALDEVMTAMDASAARASIIVIDACRDNPLPVASGRNLARGLSVVGLKPKNSIVIYAAEAGNKALDGLFTPILAMALQQKGRSINQIMMSVRGEVYSKSNGQQTPGEYNQLFEDLFLSEPSDVGELPPSKIFETISSPTPSMSPMPVARSTPQPNLKNDMVLVEGGIIRSNSEIPGKIVKNFYIGCTEVTWQKWKEVRTWASAHGYDISNLGAGTANNHPVWNVSWMDCLKWCNAKSEMEGLTPVYRVNGAVYRRGEFAGVSPSITANGYRLPTDAEWEWAASGGRRGNGFKYSGSNDLSTVGWWYKNSGGKTHAVAEKPANELGLYDMSGNVWEWTYDSADRNDWKRVRGGGWSYPPDSCEVSQRGNQEPNYRADYIGFRIAQNYE
jgi:formylglycine-generating enzyme required for sulfatase activity